MRSLDKLINPHKFSKCVNKMRQFFLEKNFIEVPTQASVNILAACEDPDTITPFNFANNTYPLPQTGQMWLETALLENPHYDGVFCQSYSFRDEPNPIEGRHERLFPMFEFEGKGDINDLAQTSTELLEYLGFTKDDLEFPSGDYVEVAKEMNTDEIENEHEIQLYEEHGPVYFLKNFPVHTSPFWNMKMDMETGIANKIDVIVHGMETIGSAERSTDKADMLKQFDTISNGEYAQKLFDHFGEERVREELNKYLEYFDGDEWDKRRYGAGIGVTRMMRGMELSGLLD